MSSFAAKMKLKGEKAGDLGEFNVVTLNYKLEAPIDIATGQRSGMYRGNLIEIDVEINPKTVQFLNTLTMNDTVSGDIKFSQINQDSTYLTITMKQASLFCYQLIFDASNAAALGVRIRLSVQDMDVTATEGGQNAHFENPHLKS
jgi:hypothetical protein